MRESIGFWIFTVFFLAQVAFSQALADTLNKQLDIAKGDLPAMEESTRPDEKMLTLQEAREYMLYLINRDRQTANCPPVKLDEVAGKAAQFHSDTMAKFHFNSHWHPDGKKPMQRYTECGGFDYCNENSHGTLEYPNANTTIAEHQLFTKREIEDEESSYFDEKPPHDGHRKNILDPQRTHVGLGITLIELRIKSNVEGCDDIDRHVTSSQEFINKRASNFSQSDTSLHKGVTYSFSGELDPGITFHSCDLEREELPVAIPMDILKDWSRPEYHGSCTIPTERILAAFPPPFLKAPNARVNLDGRKFFCEITPADSWRSGLYYVIIFATVNGTIAPISQHTLVLE